LAELEANRPHASGQGQLFAPETSAPQPDPLHARLAALDPDALSARDALALLYELKKLADGN
ncbi:MAG TPA: hypothetical protein VFX38_04110, partial [Gammaproteobacteria bacterium]|nr:hypothetical protein [Gammaproteobacteria bacterium]